MRVPILDTVVRMPSEEPAPLGAKKRKRGGTKPPSSRGVVKKGKEVEARNDNPEEGWDEETQENGTVLDYETKEQIQQRTCGLTIVVTRS